MLDVRKVSHPDVRVLVMGESGTGKETVAWQIHNKSARACEPFVAFNCASVAMALEVCEARLTEGLRATFVGCDRQMSLTALVCRL